MVKMPLTPDNLRPGLARLLKKPHLLRCARSPRSNVSVNTPPLVDFSRASHLDLFEQPGIRVFQSVVDLIIACSWFPLYLQRRRELADLASHFFSSNGPNSGSEIR